MDTYKAIINRRSIRQFKKKKIERSVLKKIADAGRLAPTPMNLQPLHFLIVDEKKKTNFMFKTLKWAGHLKSWEPGEEKQPSAYILLLVDKNLKKEGFEYDLGLAASNLMIAATGLGLGSCCLAVLDKKETGKFLKIPKNLIPILTIALGYPNQKSKTTILKGRIGYSMDRRGNILVPKRSKKDVIHLNEI